MTDFTVQGWCPGALRPMLSGDGWVVRVRARAGWLTPAQAAGIAEAARRHGNGLIDLSGRANLQIRGVRQETHAALVADLRALGLVDDDIAAETRRNILVAPFWLPGDDTTAIAAALERALADAPVLPGKFGFAVDCGAARVLAATPADIRIERGAAGGLILRADGAAEGAPVTRETAAPKAMDLARWFVARGGVTGGRGRMAALIARGVLPEGALAGTMPPAPEAARPRPGPVAQGALVALAFGQIGAASLATLAALGRPLRLTPWRMILIDGAAILPAIAGLVSDATDPILHVSACTGAPGCPQGRAPIRDLARRLAPFVPTGRHLHVSACPKGCAHPGGALTLIATADDHFDLVVQGTARDTPDRAQVPEGHLRALLAEIGKP